MLPNFPSPGFSPRPGHFAPVAHNTVEQERVADISAMTWILIDPRVVKYAEYTSLVAMVFIELNTWVDNETLADMYMTVFLILWPKHRILMT